MPNNAQTNRDRSNGNDQVSRFVGAVRGKLGLRVAAAATVWSLVVASAAAIGVGCVYVAQGYAVDWQWYAAAAGAGALAAGIAWMVRRPSLDDAAQTADRQFGLQDALVSLLHFRRDGKQGGFFDLQEQQTANRVVSLDTATIGWLPRLRPTLLGLTLAAVAIGLGMIGPSEAVQQQLALEEATLASTDENNRRLKELIDELNEQTDDPLEREMIEPDKLREMVDALGKTKDQKEALRQYAKLEQELKKQLSKLTQKKDEHLMQQAAEKLAEARETKPLAEKLNAKKYAPAAKDLEQLKPDSAKPLTEQQKQLARLRAASKRMAAAVRNQRGRTASGSPSQSAKAGESAKSGGTAQAGKSGSAAGSGGSGGGELGKAIEDLEGSLAEWDDALQEADRQMKIDGECDSECQGRCNACENAALADLDKLAKYLNRMQLKRDAQKKLASLCKACSQCQGGLCQSPYSSKMNGRGIGASSNSAERDERDELVDNGQTEALKGIKGRGPSQTAVETADEGTGVSSRGAVARRREFQKQYESFVSREDVPEEVRSGVKRYFEAIHEGE
ncbi:MAG: hypothetical protein AAGJ46_16350 [Planctomycetota bacterium]